MGPLHTCSKVSSVDGAHADASASGADTSASPPPVNLRRVAGRWCRRERLPSSGAPHQICVTPSHRGHARRRWPTAPRQTGDLAGAEADGFAGREGEPRISRTAHFRPIRGALSPLCCLVAVYCIASGFTTGLGPSGASPRRSLGRPHASPHVTRADEASCRRHCLCRCASCDVRVRVK